MKYSAHLFAIVLALTCTLPGTTLASDDADATDDVGLRQAQRTILGWSADGELLVRMNSRGERMVGGVGHAYYFETTEVYAGKDGAFLDRYKAGTPIGPVHPLYVNAGASEVLGARLGNPASGPREGRSKGMLRKAISGQLAEAFFGEGSGLEGVELAEAREEWVSPDERRAITSMTLTQFEPWEHPRRGTQHRCLVRQRAVLLDQDAGRAYVLGDWQTLGEPAAREQDVICPTATIRAFWHPDSTRWALVQTTGDISEVLAGEVEHTGQDANASPLLMSRRPWLLYIDRQPEGPLRSGLEHLTGGRLDEAEAAFDEALAVDGASIDAALGLGFVAGRRENYSDAKRYLRLAWANSDRDVWTRAQIAAIYAHFSRELSRARTHLSRALGSASSYEIMILIADLLSEVDIEMAIQAYAAALAHPTAAHAATASGHRFYIEALAAAGHDAKIRAHIQSPEAASDQAVMLALGAPALRQSLGELSPQAAARAAAELLFARPGDCDAYVVLGEALGRGGDAVGAYQQFQAARICDPAPPAPHFYLGDLAQRRGESSSAARHFKAYLERAPARRGDDIRTARRAHIEGMLARLGHVGVVLVTVECRAIAPQARLCHGTVANTLTEAVQNIEVALINTDTGAKLGTHTIDEIPAGLTRPFGVRFDASADAAEVVAETGRSDEERGMNRVSIGF